MPHSYRFGLAGLLLAALLPLAARAQANFQPGYVVRPAGDTLRGEVDSRDPYFNATQARFRPTPAAEATTYGPTELPAYGVEGRSYRALTLPGASAPVFAEVLVGGPASLYQVRDAGHNEHFYLEAPQFPLTELARKRLLLPGRNEYQEQPVYRLTLAQALPNCPAAEQQLAQLPLEAAALARVVRTFNGCRGVVAAGPVRKAHQHPRFGVLLGMERASTNLNFFAGYQQVNIAVPAATTLALGATVSLPLNLISRKLSAELAVSYSRPRFAAVGPGGESYAISLGYLRLPILLRYSFLPQAALRPVLELGATLAYATSQDATITIRNSGTTTVYPFARAEDYEHLQEGLLVGLGLQGSYWQGRRATALFRFEADNGWIQASNFNTDMNRVYLLLALDLTK